MEQIGCGEFLNAALWFASMSKKMRKDFIMWLLLKGKRKNEMTIELIEEYKHEYQNNSVPLINQ